MLSKAYCRSINGKCINIVDLKKDASKKTGTYHGNNVMNHLDAVMLSKPNIEISAR